MTTTHWLQVGLNGRPVPEVVARLHNQTIATLTDRIVVVPRERGNHDRPYAFVDSQHLPTPVASQLASAVQQDKSVYQLGNLLLTGIAQSWVDRPRRWLRGTWASDRHDLLEVSTEYHRPPCLLGPLPFGQRAEYAGVHALYTAEWGRDFDGYDHDPMPVLTFAEKDLLVGNFATAACDRLRMWGLQLHNTFVGPGSEKMHALKIPRLAYLMSVMRYCFGDRAPYLCITIWPPNTKEVFELLYENFRALTLGLEMLSIGYGDGSGARPIEFAVHDLHYHYLESVWLERWEKQVCALLGLALLNIKKEGYVHHVFFEVIHGVLERLADLSTDDGPFADAMQALLFAVNNPFCPESPSVNTLHASEAKTGRAAAQRMLASFRAMQQARGFEEQFAGSPPAAYRQFTRVLDRLQEVIPHWPYTHTITLQDLFPVGMESVIRPSM